MTILKTGDRSARLVSQRIAAQTATTTTLKAVPADLRCDGQLAIILNDSSAWVFDSDSAASGGSTVLVPDAGSGRWLALALASASTLSGFAGPRAARGVVFANVSNLAAFTVASNDGLTYAAGERVLLANQTTAAECGIYTVGTVGGGTAALTRADDWATGQTVINGSVVEISEGTIFAGSTWKAMATGSVVIGTTDPAFYPRVCKGQLTLSSGTKTLGSAEGLFVFSTTKSPWTTQICDVGGTMTNTIGYKVASAGRASGKSGTAAAIVISMVAAGTIQNLDSSTIDWTVTNF